jgi:hypothetical protein
MATEKEEEILKVFRAAADADPVAVFNQLADLRASGVDPLDAGLIPGNPVTKKVKSVDRWATQQIENAKAAGDDWLSGVQNPSRDPVSSAIAAKDKWQDRLTEAMKAGKWEKNLAKTSAAEIASIASSLGTRVYTDAFDARKGKITRVVGQIQPLIQDVSNVIQGMSDKTDSDREKRLLTARKLMIEVGKKRAGA